MKNLDHILKQLKKIEPDHNYADRSLSTIVSSPRNTHHRWLSLTFLHVFEYGGAVALVGLLFFVMLGNSSLVALFSPINSGSLSTGGLRAEAEAIDIQIKLLDLDYTESSSTDVNSTVVTSHIVRKKAARTIASPATSSVPTEITTSTTPPNVEDVLDLLAQ